MAKGGRYINSRAVKKIGMPLETRAGGSMS